MSRFHKAVSALLVAGMVGIPYTPALAMGEQRRDRTAIECLNPTALQFIGFCRRIDIDTATNLAAASQVRDVR